MDSNNKLQDLLEIEASELSSGFKKASLEGYGTPQEIADRRESVFTSFLRKYFPFPYRIVKGNIVDSFGNNSQSIDCVVLNPVHPYTIDTTNERASVILADGVDYAIELKSNLNNRSEIERALKQIQSVKKLRKVRTGIVFSNKLSSSQLDYYKTIPSIIVGENTYANINDLIEIIVNYYSHNSVPSIEQFDLLYINERALVYNFRPDSYLSLKDSRGIFYWEGGIKTLSAFLLELNALPQSVPLIDESVLEIYLKNSRPHSLSYNQILNERLLFD